MENLGLKIRFNLNKVIIATLFAPSFNVFAVQIPDGANLAQYMTTNGVYDFQGDAIFDSSSQMKNVSGNQTFNGVSGVGSSIDFRVNSGLQSNGNSVWTLNDISFINANNSITSAGNAGIIWVRNGDMELTGSRAEFINNTTGNADAGGVINQLGAGALLTLNTEYLYFQGNAGLGSGAAIWTAGNAISTGTLHFVDNKSSRYGGGIRAVSFSGSSGSEIIATGNEANLGGGAINIDGKFTSDGKLTISNNSTSAGYGGGMRAIGSDSYIVLSNKNINHLFSGNSAALSGGGITTTIKLDVSGSVVFENNKTGESGGAIYVGTTSGAPLSTSTATLGNADADVIFNGNSAGVDLISQNIIGRGGAVYSQGSLSIEGVKIEALGNKAMADGGAFYTMNQLSLLGRFAVSNNLAGSGTGILGSGGALYSAGDFNIKALGDSSFSNNSASDKGGAFYLNGTAEAQGSLLAESGSIVFEGNKHGVTDTSSGNANAIYIENQNYTLNLSASNQSSISFYDPVSSSDTSDITINVNPNGQTGQILFSGERYAANTDDVFSSVSADTIVHAGTFAVKDNARFGNEYAETFSVLTNASLNTIATNFGATNYLKAKTFEIDGALSFLGQTSRMELLGDVNAKGRISLVNNNIGDVLFIDGNYTGSNAYATLEAFVAGDGSPSDIISITGNASGLTNLIIDNIGGAGAFAPNGILVVTTDSSDDGAFRLIDDHVAVGPYDYTLLRRTETNGDNWYLHNAYDIDGDGEPDPEAGPTYTPGLGSVIANTIAANSLFNMRFEDREGAGQSQLGAKTQDNLWVRYSGGNNKFRALNNQLHTSGHSSALQIGVGLPSLLESHSIDLGVMAGYGHYKGNTKSSRTDRKSSSDVDGYSVGLYGTWYSDPASQSGMYVDSWLLWNHFNNRITGADDNKYSYKSKGITASIEVGKGYAIGELNGADIWMQPQAQVIYQGVRADKVTDAQDVTAKRGSANVQLRAGVKTYADDIMLGNMSSRPFVEVNYIHNTDHYSVKIDDSTYRAAGGKNIGEIRLGLEGNVLGSHQMWINTGYADGGKHYQDFSIQAGWKYQF